LAFTVSLLDVSVEIGWNNVKIKPARVLDSLDLLHLIENVFTLTPAITLTLKRNYVFGLTK